MPLRVFISYSHDSQEHMDRVWNLSERLRRHGVDCRIDQHGEPEAGWPRWSCNQVQECEFVLVVCTETYRRRYEGKADPGEGRGSKWEGFVISQELYEAEGKNKKFIPILFSSGVKEHIPIELRPFTYYQLSDEANYNNLFGRITGQSERTPSPIADQVRQMPKRETAAAGTAATSELPPVQPLERRSPAPKPLNRLFTVPFPENPFFTGREEILASLKADLDKSGIAALTGLGGMGKTQTAAQFAHRHRDEYPAVLWVRAESLETLFADLSLFASRLGLPERDAKEQSAVLDAVKRWLDEQEQWLLVLDNVEEYEIVRDLTRKADARRYHHIILTTQRQALGGIARQRVLPMDRNQGALLLLRRANRLDANAALSDADSQQAALAREISDEVGGLPLALDQAGAYIEENASALNDYQMLLRERTNDLLDRRGGLDSDHLSVAKTFLTSFVKLEKLNPAAPEILQIAAFLPPDAIPEEIFTKGEAEFRPELSATASDAWKWNEAIGAALKYSLLERDPEKKLLAVHRMVQAVLKSQMSDEKQKLTAEQAVRAVNAAFPSVEFGRWTNCERLVPSAQTCATLAEEQGLSSPELARLLSQAGYFLSERARNVEAEPLYRKSLALAERLYGSDDTEVAIGLNNLAALLKETNRSKEAEPLMRRALEIDEKSIGSDHPKIAIRLSNLASLLQDTNRLQEAEPLMLRALEIDERSYGPDHPNVARDLSNLAQLLQATDRLKEAEPLMRRALEIDERAYGPDHPNVAIRLSNLASLLKTTNRLNEAEPLMRRALESDEKSLGSEHPNVAIRLNNLARLLMDTNRLKEAEPLIRRALEIDERSLGSDHPNFATHLNNLAQLLQDTNRLAAAEPLMRRALEIDERSYGPDHRDVAIGLNNLALLLHAINRLQEAEPLMRRALEISERSLGPDHPNTVTVRNNLAALLRVMGKDDEADKLA
jgi:tetratricopeptide (TPR) repeat protein